MKDANGIGLVSGEIGDSLCCLLDEGMDIRMKRILALVPQEDRAGRSVLLAGALAEKRSAAVTLLRVIAPMVDPSIAYPETQVARDGSKRFADALRDAEEAQLERLADVIRAKGVEVTTEVAWGVPWQLVLDRVQRDRVDLVVKPASGLSKAGRVFFGSTALHLFRRCPCPVWVVGDDAGLPARVLAAVDPTGGERRRLAAHSVIDWANEISDWTDDGPEFISVWSAAGTDIEGLEWGPDEKEQYRSFAYHEAELALLKILEDRRECVTDDSVHMVEGDPAEALSRFSDGRSTDLIVMGTRTRPDAIGDLLGETAETVIRQVRCSILTVPPGSHPDQDGFLDLIEPSDRQEVEAVG